MRIRTSALLLTLFLLSCSSTPRTTLATPAAARVYHGTASVGDFMTITVDAGFFRDLLGVCDVVFVFRRECALERGWNLQLFLWVGLK